MSATGCGKCSFHPYTDVVLIGCHFISLFPPFLFSFITQAMRVRYANANPPHYTRYVQKRVHIYWGFIRFEKTYKRLQCGQIKNCIRNRRSGFLINDVRVVYKDNDLNGIRHGNPSLRYQPYICKPGIHIQGYPSRAIFNTRICNESLAWRCRCRTLYVQQQQPTTCFATPLFPVAKFSLGKCLTDLVSHKLFVYFTFEGEKMRWTRNAMFINH